MFELSNQGMKGSEDRFDPQTKLTALAKMLESIILLTLNAFLLVAYHQYVFREDHIAITTSTDLMALLSYNLNRNQLSNRTLVAALDLTKGFDTISHLILLGDILSFNL